MRLGPSTRRPRRWTRCGIGVEEVRRAVQADGGLAGARGALHADGPVQLGAYEVVLLGLDGRRDVPHGADAGALDLPGEDRAGPRRLPRRQVLVLQAGQVLGGAGAPLRPAEPAADRDALGVAGARLVEAARDGGPPVDDEGRGGGVFADAAAADVVALAGVVAVGRRVEVEPPEEQRALRQSPSTPWPSCGVDSRAPRRRRRTRRRSRRCTTRCPAPSVMAVRAARQVSWWARSVARVPGRVTSYREDHG